MSGSTNSLLRFGFGQAPTAQFSLRDSYGAGIDDTQRERRNALALQEAERQQQAGEVIRQNAPAAMSGDPEALRALIAADPRRATELQQAWAGLDATRQQAAIRNVGVIGSAAASLLALPADQRPAAYARLRADLASQGIPGLPETYPGDAVIEARARMAVPANTTLATLESRAPATSDGTQPRGYRNNNPLNIEAGQFTQGMPGFAGSDGRFARFETMDQGIAAADALLQRYATNQGLNTVGGIIGRWAPAGDGNDISAYAGRVAAALGVRADQPLDMNDPAVRRRLIEAMAQHENGRPLPTGQDAWRIVTRANGEPAVRDNLALMEGPDGQRVWRERPRPGYRYNAAGDMERIPQAGGNRLPAAIQRLDSDDVRDIQTSRNIETDLATVRGQLERGEFQTDPVNRAGYWAGRVTGLGGEEGARYQSFSATLERMRNDSLRLNKGVQTEGDAQRAWNENFPSLNDREAVIRRLAEIESINRRGAALRLLDLNRRRRENGVAEISLDDIWRRQEVLGDRPGNVGATTPAAGRPAAPRVGEVQDGYRFRGGNPADQASWERVN